MKEKSKEINEQVEYGLNSIDPDSKIEIKLKDFMFIYKTFEEFNRFFHQPDHYKTIEDIETYLGNRDSGAYALIYKLIYKILDQYLPKEIEGRFDDEDDPFHHPEFPYYYKLKNDENIDDETLNVKDRESFINFVKELHSDYLDNGDDWENNTLTKFIETIAVYADDIDGYYKNMKFDTSPNVPTWRIFAQILKGATIYE
jgi:hypothetical protein